MEQLPSQVQVELSADKLEKLIQEGHLCAAEIRCLNNDSKQRVWQMCLKLCGKSLCLLQSNQAHTKDDCKRIL